MRTFGYPLLHGGSEKLIQTLLRKHLAARILMWTCLATVVLPISIAVVGFLWYRSRPPMAGLGFAMTMQFWAPVPLFGLLGFVMALEWKQGLDERIKQAQDDHTKVVR